MKIKRWFFIGLVSLLALAERGMALQVAPSYQVFLLQPNQPGVGEFLITNTEEDEIKVTPSSKDWFVLPDNKGLSAADWLQIDSTTFVMNPGESRKIKFEIQPATSAVGELVGMASFLTVPAAQESSINTRVSAAVYAGMEGKSTLKGELVGFTASLSTQTLTAGILLRNIGNVHIRPRGVIEIKTDKNKTMAYIYLDKGGPVYPGSSNGYFGDVKMASFPAGKYSAHITLNDADRNATVLDVVKKFKYTKDGKVEVRE